MSEMYNEDAIFESIRQDLEDPYVVDFFANIKNKQETINDEYELGNFSEDRRSKLITELDKGWIYFGHDVYINGRITPLDDSGSTLIVEEVKARSKGFEVYKSGIVDGSMGDESSLRIGMVFTLENSDGSIISALADINDISLEYPFPSREKMEQKLDGSDLSEYREKIDEIVFADGSIEDIMKSLADFRYEYNRDRGIDLDATKALERYINDTIGFDKQLPYYVQIENEIFIEKDGHYHKREVIDLLDVAGVEKVVLLDANEPDESGRADLSCFLKMWHYSPIQNESPTSYYVSVDNINSFSAIRDDVDTEFFD